MKTKMINHSIWGAAVLLLLFMTSCDNIAGTSELEINAIDQVEAFSGSVDYMMDAEICGEAKVVTLWAGQHINAGTLNISNDEEYLYVTFETKSSWYLKKTHLHVAKNLKGIPSNPQGIPVPGHFEYSKSHDYVTSYTYKISLDDLYGDDFVIAAHAEVVKKKYGKVVQKETAWGGNKEGPGRRWWFYAAYSLQDCVDNGNGEIIWKEETAFGGDSKGYGSPWWYYFDAECDSTQSIYAGQKRVEGASVSYIDGQIIISLGEYMRMMDDEESVKIFGYNANQLPDGRPVLGATNPNRIYAGQELTVDVEPFRYYVIHLDVEVDWSFLD
jgi:hypothetical protein